MTIIVAAKGVDGTFIGADKIASKGWDSRARVDKKVFLAHGIKYGFTSSYRMGQILQFHSIDCGEDELMYSDPFAYTVKYLVPMWRKVLSEHKFSRNVEGEDIGGEFIVVVSGEIFIIESDFQVRHVAEGYAACGCGENYALGCLFNLDQSTPPEHKIKLAIETATYFSNGCGGGLDII